MFLSRPRLSRGLSAFDHTSHRWAAVSLWHDPIAQRPSSHPAEAHAAVHKQALSLTSWNIQASQSKPTACCELILDHILQGPKFPDIIHLQEVSSSARQFLLNDPRIRSNFLTTDAEDDTIFKGVPFATMMLLSSERFSSPLLSEEQGEREHEGGSTHTGTTMVCSQRSTECLHCICNNVATERARSSTVRIYYICIIENGYTAFARSALYTQNARHSAIGPSYRQQLLAITNQPT